jgi:hypothetical protein
MATKKTPVITTVMVRVSSIVFQLEARGVVHQGVARWKTTEPSTMTSRTAAMTMSVSARDAVRRCQRVLRRASFQYSRAALMPKTRCAVKVAPPCSSANQGKTWAIRWKLNR